MVDLFPVGRILISLKVMGYYPVEPSCALGKRKTLRYRVVKYVQLAVASALLLFLWVSAALEFVVSIEGHKKTEDLQRSSQSSAEGDGDSPRNSQLIDLVFRLRYSFRRLSLCFVVTIFFCKRKLIRKALRTLRNLTYSKGDLLSSLPAKLGRIMNAGLFVTFILVITSWLGLLLVDIYHTINDPTIVMVEFLDRLPNNAWIFLTGSACSPGEVATGMITTLVIVVAVALTAHVDLLVQKAGTITSGSQADVESLVTLKTDYMELRRVIHEMDRAFGWVIVVAVCAQLAPVFSYSPIFLRFGVIAAFTTFFTHLIIHLVAPMLAILGILIACAKTGAKNVELQEKLRELASSINEVALSRQADCKLHHSGQRSRKVSCNECKTFSRVDTIEADTRVSLTSSRVILACILSLLRACERYPIAMDAGFMGVIKFSTISEVAIIYGGYVCFMIERGERADSSIETLSNMLSTTAVG